MSPGPQDLDYPPALFAYDAAPRTVPFTDDSTRPSTVTLMVTVNNSQPVEVDCVQIVFALPVGVRNGDLTANPSTIACTPVQGVPWSIDSDDNGNFTAMPSPPARGLDVGDSIAFLLSGIEVNDLPGQVMITVYEVTDETREWQVPLVKVEPGLAITSFTASPVQVRSGQDSTLSWTTTGAETCRISWDGGGVDVAPEGTRRVQPERTTTYTLSASGDGRTLVAQITVYVPQVAILSFGATPARVGSGEPVTLSWLVDNADECRIDPGVGDVDPHRGEHVVHPGRPRTYKLVASGAGRTVSMGAPVRVESPLVEWFEAAPSQVPPGQVVGTTLSWSTRWATGCSIVGVQDDLPPSGSLRVSPSETTTYLLEPHGYLPHPVSAAVTVTVGPAITFLRLSSQDRPGLIAVTWATVGGGVTLDIGPARHGMPASGTYVAEAPWPEGPDWALGLTVTGKGLASSVRIALPSQDIEVMTNLQMFSFAGINAPGATGLLAWTVGGDEASGTFTGEQTESISGDEGVLGVPFGAGSGDRLWSVHLDVESGPGHRFAIVAGMPRPLVDEPQSTRRREHPDDD